jgi:hypothetical protein
MIAGAIGISSQYHSTYLIMSSTAALLKSKLLVSENCHSIHVSIGYQFDNGQLIYSSKDTNYGRE